MFALIDPSQNNLIVDLQAAEFPVAPPLTWAVAPNGAMVYGHTLTNGILTPVTTPTTQAQIQSQMTATPYQFINKFTSAEQLAIVTATMSNPSIKLWYDKMLAANEVIFNDPNLIAGLNALVTAGLLTQARMDVIVPPSLRSSNVTVL